MKFSYRVNGQYLLKSIDLPLQPGHAYLLSGPESTTIKLLGGIIAKLFPVKEKLPWPQLQRLIENYTGELEETKGLPDTGVYIGSDPEHHLLFSKVKEELEARNLTSGASNHVLSSFGLDESFLQRRINELSGGEKMRVCLAIAFSRFYECYVLHGVIPWLDKKGRQILVNQIINAKKNGSYVVLIEHEVYPLKDILDTVYEFDGITARKANEQAFSFNVNDLEINSYALTLLRTLSKSPNSKSVFEFRNVSLFSHPDHNSIRAVPLLEGISFELTQRRVYFLVGNNGAGKSTIAQLAFKTLLPDSGGIYLSGQSIKNLSRNQVIEQICYIAQNPEKQITLSNIGQYKQQVASKGNDLSLDLMGKYLKLPNGFPISQLSALQMKLLGLTSTINRKTKLLILDEPTWGLDRDGQIKLLELLNEISNQLELSLLIISHDISLIHSLDASVLWINEGQLRQFDKPDDFFSNEAAGEQFDFQMYKQGLTARI